MTDREQRAREVTQADREAAAALVEWLSAAQAEWEGMVPWFHWDAPKAFREGAFDGHEWPQAFARHRIAAQDAAYDEAAKVARKRAALYREKAERVADDFDDSLTRYEGRIDCADACDYTAAAIEALKERR